MSLFEEPTRRASVPIAKNRLKSLLVSDRMHCTPDQFEKLTKDLYFTFSKYIEVNEDIFHLSIEEHSIHISF